MTNLDLSFDPHFEKRPALRWWPWVGSQYASSPVRTLVLGESIYEWTKTPREQEIFRSRYARPDALRVTHLNHALQFKRNSRYVRNIERAVCVRPNRRMTTNSRSGRPWRITTSCSTRCGR